MLVLERWATCCCGFASLVILDASITPKGGEYEVHSGHRWSRGSGVHSHTRDVVRCHLLLGSGKRSAS
jgi:hypothetical protein